MYITALDVKMDLNIHEEIAEFINNCVNESQTMHLEDVRDRLQWLLVQEVSGDTMSDVGAGIDIAIQLVNKVIKEIKDEKCNAKSSVMKWIPVETEKKPKKEEYILLSFENFSVPCVGRYEEDEEGGAFYIGDEEESCIHQDMIVNAWMPMPKCYKGEDK